MERILSATHPDDRALSHTKRARLFRHGGAFVFEHRILPSPYVTRWVLVQGYYELDASGQGVQSRGIVVDMTESRQEDRAEGAFFVTDADNKTVRALERATKHVLASRQAFGELDPESFQRFRSIADTLLLEIAHHIANTMAPVTSSRTQH